MKKIVVSKGAGSKKYDNYMPWLSSVDKSFEVIELSTLSDADAIRAIHSANGIVFTGGEDIHPRHYGMPEALEVCGELDEERDARELPWFELSLKREIPILGICRGMQLANVVMEGTLIPHIPYADTHRHDEKDMEHTIDAHETSILRNFLEAHDAGVNSAHHQAVDRVSSEFHITARSPDGIAEAIEWKDPRGKSFFLGVQWHPERVTSNHGLSHAIAEAFMRAAKQH